MGRENVELRGGKHDGRRVVVDLRPLPPTIQVPGWDAEPVGPMSAEPPPLGPKPLLTFHRAGRLTSDGLAVYQLAR